MVNQYCPLCRPPFGRHRCRGGLGQSADRCGVDAAIIGDGDLGRIQTRTHGATERTIMNGVVFLLPIAIFLGLVFLVLFIVAVRSGQFDDVDDPPERMLRD